MLKRPLTVFLTAAAVLASPASASAHTLGDWNRPEQRIVMRAGLLPAAGGGFHGERPLTAAELRGSLRALAARIALAPVTPRGGRITVVRFDSALVAQLGLADVAATVQHAAARAGLHPPGYFGSEVVARYLGLRDDHPASDDALELYPTDTITRAEAAHSLSTALGFSGWELTGARAELSGFSLPHYSAAERRVLSIAVSKIGMPYVWGGTTDDRSDGRAHGGYDCSGFAWRVYKLSGLPWGRQINGRTAAQQAGEIPRARRVRMRAVRPGDLLFFGSAGFRARATEASVIHEGIALSRDWVIHSSDQGVYVLPLTSGWLHDRFSWARHLL